MMVTGAGASSGDWAIRDAVNTMGSASTNRLSSVMSCAAMAGVASSGRKNGANFLANLTNDAIF